MFGQSDPGVWLHLPQLAEPMADGAKLLGLTGQTFDLVVLLAGHDVLLQSIHRLHSVVDTQVHHPAKL